MTAVPARALRTLAAYLLLTGKARLIFRDLHSEALSAAERAFRHPFAPPREHIR